MKNQPKIISKKGIAIRGTIYYSGHEKDMPELTEEEFKIGVLHGKLENPDNSKVTEEKKK